jgi:glycosyltransferase involved in cell wall biosynthesis
MNILWFNWKDRSNPLAGGAEVVNEELARRLAQDGHTVTFIVAGFPGSKEQTTRHGFRIVRVGGRFTSYLAAWRYYRRHRAELAPDLVIDECNTMPYFASLYTGGVPTVLLIHQLCRGIWFSEFPQPLSTIGYLLEPLYLRILSKLPVITVSESTKRDLMRYGFRAQNIHIISEGIEPRPIPSLTAAKKYPHPTLLCLGAMRSMKRTLHQIRAFELAKAAIPDLELIVAGDSSSRYGQKVLRAIMRSSYASDIYYHGRVSPAKKLSLMQHSHLILATSIKEGWGLTVTEANAQGTPAVAYNADGLRDSIRHGQTGLLTITNTPQALAEAAVTLLRDPKRYQAFRHTAWRWSHYITFDRSYADLKRALSLSKPS